MKYQFETDYPTILKKIEAIDPIEYCKSRNYIDGAVTYLSPYISRGVISTKQVLQSVVKRGYKFQEIEHFIKELCWRDYFQRVQQNININAEIKNKQEFVNHFKIPEAIVNAETGVDGVDSAINELYNSGYMHNHCRMYTASLVCNIGKSHWMYPAKWMYYHLLDGDWASNVCSWQWVAGANSNKKYYVNQENVNKFTHTNQSGTILDMSYEEIAVMDIPEQLSIITDVNFEIHFPLEKPININASWPTYIYNYYNLDPVFCTDENANKVLLLEPDFFSQYPVSKKCIDFMMELSRNIPDIQIYVGSFQTLKSNHNLNEIYYKEHPFNLHYEGIKIERDWIVEGFDAYYPSFFSYWNKISKSVKILFENEKN